MSDEKTKLAIITEQGQPKVQIKRDIEVELERLSYEEIQDKIDFHSKEIIKYQSMLTFYSENADASIKK